LNNFWNLVFKQWEKLPKGFRYKPLDAFLCILLLMASFAGLNIQAFSSLNFLYEELPFTEILQYICVSYVLVGSLLILYGLFFHHKHNKLLSFCKTELWGWRLIFSASAAMTLAEVFFGTQSGISIGATIWTLQLIASALKLFVCYDEKNREKQLWTS
jgi:hypothetical protein